MHVPGKYYLFHSGLVWSGFYYLQMYVGSEHIFGHRTSEDELDAWGPFMHAKRDGVGG
jgi:hypothetical protein